MIAQSLAAGFALLLGGASVSQYGNQPREAMYHGHKIFYPKSSLPRPGLHHTNYFVVDSYALHDEPLSGAETPGSIACVYKLVPGSDGCPIATSTKLPTGGWGAIAIVDAGDYPNAASDLDAFSKKFGLPPADLTVTWPGSTKPPVYNDWIVEEALDLEWAHAMAPNAKLILVESVQENTDPTWDAVTLAANLVQKAGGGVVSMSWGDPEESDELKWDAYFTAKDVIFFAASGDSGMGVSSYPGASPNVISVGGTHFERDAVGKFTQEVYDTQGGANISPYEPIPAYQQSVSNVVGQHRGYPDVASNFCCASIYVNGGWMSVGGTSWGSPTFAGIVNAAGTQGKSTLDELNLLYQDLGNPTQYKADFNNVQDGSKCTSGFNQCTGIGSAKTYAGK